MNSRLLQPVSAARALLLALGLSSLAACMTTEKPIHLSSDPPGARVLVDGDFSGFVTPCMLDLPREKTRVGFELTGFVTAERKLRPESTWTTIYWREMSLVPRIWFFPLWLNRNDSFAPFKRDKSLAPNRVHVRLKRSADSPAL